VSSNSFKNLTRFALAGIVLAVSGVAWVFLTAKDGTLREAPPSPQSARGQTVFQLADLSAIIDPRSDGWESEAFAEAAQAQLDQLAQALLKNPSADELGEFELKTRLPKELAVKFADPATGTIIRSSAAVSAGTHRKLAGLSDLSNKIAESEGARVYLKISSVELAGGSATTAVRYEATHPDRQQTAHWRCEWRRSEAAPPKLSSIELLDFEEAQIPGERWFADHTVAVLGDNDSFHQQLAHGLHHWLGRIDRAHGIGYFKRHGLAVGDANGDGLDDLYLCQAGGLPNRLFLQNVDGTATDVSAKFGVDYLDHTSSALLVDLDNDGDQDLVLAMFDGVQLLENTQNRGFVHRSSLEMLDTDLASLSAADFDNDGDLDLYITVDFAEKGAHSKSGTELPGFVYHDANDGGKNVLFQNDSGWEFRDVTSEVGLDANNRRHSLAAAWDDFDRDGDLDLYVANDYGQNCLYRNTNGPEPGSHFFTDVANELGVIDYGSGMSVSWGDYDRDAQSDLYVGNMFSNAGNRIARQTRFLPGSSAAVRALNLRFAKGNTLFHGNGSTFEETGTAAGVGMGRWAWSSLFADLNNDGWEDLFVANGYITTPDSGDL